MLKKVLLMTSVCVASITAQSQASWITSDDLDAIMLRNFGGQPAQNVVPPQPVPVQNVAPVQPVQNNPNNVLLAQIAQQQQDLVNLNGQINNLNIQRNQGLADLQAADNARQVATGERNALQLIIDTGMNRLHDVQGNNLLARIAAVQQQLADALNAQPAQGNVDVLNLQGQLANATRLAGERLQFINDGNDLLQAFAVPDDDLLARIVAAHQQLVDARNARADLQRQLVAETDRADEKQLLINNGLDLLQNVDGEDLLAKITALQQQRAAAEENTRLAQEAARQEAEDARIALAAAEENARLALEAAQQDAENERAANALQLRELRGVLELGEGEGIGDEWNLAMERLAMLHPFTALQNELGGLDGENIAAVLRNLKTEIANLGTIITQKNNALNRYDRMDVEFPALRAENLALKSELRKANAVIAEAANATEVEPNLRKRLTKRNTKIENVLENIEPDNADEIITNTNN